METLMQALLVTSIMIYVIGTMVCFITGMMKHNDAKRRLDMELFFTYSKEELEKEKAQGSLMVRYCLTWPVLAAGYIRMVIMGGEATKAPKRPKNKRLLTELERKEAGDEALLGYAAAVRRHTDKDVLIRWSDVARDVEDWVAFDMGQDYRKDLS